MSATCSKRLLAAAIHKKAYIYEIAAAPSAGPVRLPVLHDVRPYSMPNCWRALDRDIRRA